MGRVTVGCLPWGALTTSTDSGTAQGGRLSSLVILLVPLMTLLTQ